MKVIFCRFYSLLSLALLFAVVVSVGTAQGATIDQEVFEVAGLQESLKLKVFLTR